MSSPDRTAPVRARLRALLDEHPAPVTLTAAELEALLDELEGLELAIAEWVARTRALEGLAMELEDRMRPVGRKVLRSWAAGLAPPTSIVLGARPIEELLDDLDAAERDAAEWSARARRIEDIVADLVPDAPQGDALGDRIILALADLGLEIEPPAGWQERVMARIRQMHADERDVDLGGESGPE